MKNYMKNFNEMNETEKKAYLDRVVDWTEGYDELMALADSWQAVPEKDVDEGLMLCSALRKAQPFIDVARSFEIKSALRNINGFLKEVMVKSGMANVPTRTVGDPRQFKAFVPAPSQPNENGETKAEFAEVDVDGRRPEHLSQYIDILPPALQKECEGIKDMYLALGEYRHRLEYMADDPRVSDEARAEFAKKAVESELKIRDLWQRIDHAYKVATNQIKEEEQEEAMKRPGEYTKSEIDLMADEAKREVCKKARIDLNKKYVRRSDVKLTEDYSTQLELRVKELLDWGEILPAKAMENCKRAGVVIAGWNEINTGTSLDKEEDANEDSETETEGKTEKAPAKKTSKGTKAKEATVKEDEAEAGGEA